MKETIADIEQLRDFLLASDESTTQSEYWDYEA